MSVLPWRPWRDRPIVLPGAGTGKRPCTEMPLAEHNNMVKTIPSDRTMNIAATAASPRRSAITVRAMPRRQPSETCAARQRAVDHPRQGGK
jgi:hypothetical protein